MCTHVHSSDVERQAQGYSVEMDTVASHAASCSTWPLSSEQKSKLQALGECPESHFVFVTSLKTLSNLFTM